jgi:hypothetical protein
VCGVDNVLVVVVVLMRGVCKAETCRENLEPSYRSGERGDSSRTLTFHCAYFIVSSKKDYI